MKKPDFSIKKATDPVIALLFALCILVVAFLHLSPGYGAMAPAINSFFVMQPDSVTEEPIDGYAGVRRVYTFDMSQQPHNSGRGRTLFVYLRHTAALLEMGGRVYVDTIEWRVTDHRFYLPNAEFSNSFYIGRTPGNYWLTLPIYADYDEQVMRLTLIPIYESVRDEEPMFFMIDREPLINLILLPREGALMALSVAAIIMGVFLSLLSLLIGLDRQDRPRVFYLGAVAAAAGMWKLCGLSVVPLLLDYRVLSKVIWYLGATRYLLMLVLSLRLLCAVAPEGETKAGAASCLIAALGAAALLVLQAGNVLELHDALVPFALVAAALHLVSFWGQNALRPKLLWTAPTLLALGADLLTCRVTGSIATAPAFLLWIMGNLFVRGVLFLRSSLRREKAFRIQEAALHEARIRSMMSQIRPHFIYNSLSAIRVLCRTDADRAGASLENLSEYLRDNFTAIAQSDPIPFDEELRHTRAYLSVESMLYEENLQVRFDTPHTGFLLPALTLQPIVENAVKHSSRASRSDSAHPPIRILIRTRETAGYSEILVEDNSGGFDPELTDGGPHIGLQNVRERLELMCRGTLDISSIDGGAAVVVRIPKEIKNR